MDESWTEVRARRDRATDLRRLAARIDDSALRDLAALAGADTWVGPTAQAFVDSLHRAGRLLDQAVDDLRARAGRLEADADEIAQRLRLAEHGNPP